MTTDTTLLAFVAPALRHAFLEHDYTVDGLATALGDAGVAALDRSDAASTARLASGAGPRGELLRLFVLGEPLARTRIAELLPELDLDIAVRSGLLDDVAGTDSLASGVDLRPVDTGSGAQWVFSDLDGTMVRVDTRPDHVLGVGQASLSLLGITPPGRTRSVLDLGTGCGIQLLSQDAERRVGTDITPRCLDFAAATAAINDLDVDLRAGSWFSPVEGERFDRIVANPPFVIGTPDIGHSYRESGLHLDGATKLVTEQAAEHLTPGGVATLLGSWVLQDGEGWRSRLADWIPAEGVSAWILLRDISGPEQYVWTWLTDEGVDPRTPEYRESAARWLDHFAAENVGGLGFGYIYLQAIDGPSEVVCEELTHPFDPGLGAEALAHFARADWLRDCDEEDIDACVFEIAPSVVIYESQRLGNASGRAGVGPAPGESASWFVVERASGPRWRHEVDATIASVLRGIEQGGLPLAEIVQLAALSRGLDEQTAGREIRSMVVDLFRHGIVVPRGARGMCLEEWWPAHDERSTS